MKQLPDNSIDSIVTDPPYGLSFMGKKWDYDVPSVEIWRECLRVLKPGGYLLSFAGTRTQHRMACNIEDAGFEIRDMIAWVYGSGFPKSLNVGKSVNQLETNEWSKIGKALDNIDQKSIMDVWKTNAKPAGIQLSKSLTEVGSNTPKKFFVPDIAVLYSNQKNELLNATIAEMRLKGLSLILEEDGIIAVESAGQTIELLPENARLAVKLSESQNLKCWNIFTAQCDVKEWLNENTEVNLKVDEALKTLRGNKKYSNEEITNVLCAELTDILKLTILNQSKTFQNLDTNQKTECASAINVIITEYTAENLISNTVDILKGKAVDKLQGNEREFVCKNPANRPYNLTKGETSTGWQSPPRPDKDKGSSPWEGFGTALKPALEPITVARKPIEKGLSVAENCLKWGTGGINIDGCRVEFEDTQNAATNPKYRTENGYKQPQKNKDGVVTQFSSSNNTQNTTGRFPANVIHDGSEDVMGRFPNTKKGAISGYDFEKGNQSNPSRIVTNIKSGVHFGDEGSAARFFKECKFDNDIHFCYLCAKDIKNELWKHTSVNNVAKSSETTQATIENIVHLNVEDLPEELLVHFVGSAGSLCEKCAMNFVHEVVEIKHLGFNQGTSQVIRDFIGNYRKCTLLQNLVSYVEKWEAIDTTPITTSLLKLFGSANRVITNYIQEIKKSEPSSFIYTPKASKSERGEFNNHPTVKPMALMRYLCRMVTPKGGTVLDPFMGSGTTGIAAKVEGYSFIGIEREEEYCKIAEARIAAWEEEKIVIDTQQKLF